MLEEEANDEMEGTGKEELVIYVKYCPEFECSD
jgi:hypothetical protein